MNQNNNIKLEALPKHLAIIMDGNGRWAKKQGLLRTIGHESGAKAVRETVETCARLGIKNLTLFAFSTENWSRPKLEVDTLMKLLSKALKKELKTLTKNDIRLNTIGNIESLPKSIVKSLTEVTESTKENQRMTLTLALNYGSKEEITRATKLIANKVKDNIILIDDIDESVINNHLYTHNLPDVDLVIRTSGEQRISNFLLWQIAYAEFYFTETLWPDFTADDLMQAIQSFQNRERRFGKTSEQLQ